MTPRPQITRFRPGVKPDDGRPRALITRDLVDVGHTAPQHPALRDWLTLGGPWPMLGNADWGDCVEAGGLHYCQAVTAYALGRPVVAQDGDALGLYSILTGFNQKAGPPGSNPTDQGTDPLDLLNYWRKTGLTITSADGTRTLHKILAFGQVDHTDLELVKACIDIFGGLLATLQIPDYAMDQFNAGRPWAYQKGGHIEGGHLIELGAYEPNPKSITWGAEQEIEPDFWAAFIDGVYAVVPDRDWFTVQGSTPSGFDAYGFGQQFAQLTGENNPFPAPTPVPDPPAPQPTPDPGPVTDTPSPADLVLYGHVKGWIHQPHLMLSARTVARELRTWAKAKGLTTGGT